MVMMVNNMKMIMVRNMIEDDDGEDMVMHEQHEEDGEQHEDEDDEQHVDDDDEQHDDKEGEQHEDKDGEQHEDEDGEQHDEQHESLNFTGVTILLSSDNTCNCVQAKKDKKRYKKRSLEVNNRAEQYIENQSKDEKALDEMRAITLSVPIVCTTLSLNRPSNSTCVLGLENLGILSVLPCGMLIIF